MLSFSLLEMRYLLSKEERSAMRTLFKDQMLNPVNKIMMEVNMVEVGMSLLLSF